MNKGIMIAALGIGGFAAIVLATRKSSAATGPRGVYLPGQRCCPSCDPLPQFLPGITASDVSDDDPRSRYYNPRSPANTLPLPDQITARMLPPEDPRSAFMHAVVPGPAPSPGPAPQPYIPNVADPTSGGQSQPYQPDAGVAGYRRSPLRSRFAGRF